MQRQAVIKTLLYSDFFDYPLTKSEIWKYLITQKKLNQSDVDSLLKDKNIKTEKGFYFLQGRRQIVELRLKREKESRKKLKLAIQVSNKLKFIPTIKFLGISGSVSVKNANEDEDIDLFVISSKNRIWTTRLLCILALKLIGVYRDRSEKDVKNKFCLNMLIDENNLNFPKSRQDIYTAHEIVQLFPLFQRSQIYNKFLESNRWINKYMANFNIPNNTIKNEREGLFLRIFEILNFEGVAKYLQKTYMKKRNGLETIKDGFLAFHPDDPREKWIKAYKMRLKSGIFKTLGH